MKSGLVHRGQGVFTCYKSARWALPEREGIDGILLSYTAVQVEVFSTPINNVTVK